MQTMNRIRNALLVAAAAFVSVPATVQASGECARRRAFRERMRMGPYFVRGRAEVRVGIWSPGARGTFARRVSVRARNAETGEIIRRRATAVQSGGGQVLNLDDLPTVNMIAVEGQVHSLTTKKYQTNNGQKPLRVNVTVFDGVDRESQLDGQSYEAWPAKWRPIGAH